MPTSRMDGGGGEDAKARIARLGSELDALAQPDDLPGMILSGNAVRRSEYLEAANLKRSEIIAAYREYTAHLEGLVAAALEIQSELTELVRMQSEMAPGRSGRARSGSGGRPAKRAAPAGRAKAGSGGRPAKRAAPAGRAKAGSGGRPAKRAAGRAKAGRRRRQGPAGRARRTAATSPATIRLVADPVSTSRAPSPSRPTAVPRTVRPPHSTSTSRPIIDERAAHLRATLPASPPPPRPPRASPSSSASRRTRNSRARRAGSNAGPPPPRPCAARLAAPAWPLGSPAAASISAASTARLTPTPTMTESITPDAPADASTSIPAALRPPTSRSLGHFRSASMPADFDIASASARAADSGTRVAAPAGGPGSATTDIHRPPGGDTHRLPSRPRPAVCVPATTTRPSALPPAPAASDRARSCVESADP